jgi:hypothetical protein
MQYHLSTLFLLFVVLWSSLAFFGPGGVIAFILLVMLALYIAADKSRWPLIARIAAVAAWLVVGLLLLPAVSSCREAVRRIVCSNNLKQIALALQSYEKRCGCLPPPAVFDADGRAIHSWRVLILPDLGRADLYSQYDFSQPWDGPNNTPLLPMRPDAFRCPTQTGAFAANATAASYLAVTGQIAAWRRDKPTSLNDPALRPHADRTILLIDDGSGVPWTAPRDVSLDDVDNRGRSGSKPLIRCPHMRDNGCFFYETPAGSNAAFLYGHIRFLPASVFAANNAKRLLVVGGASEENIAKAYASPDLTEEPRFHWPNCIAFAVWLASSGWLLVRAVRSRKAAAEHAAEQAD